ncbi:MAG: regulatory protein GemA [Butyrivibrio sp.]|nr:regulatory protein GemA [Acetatifactor muris]MCM1561577.1 regulatory protein GemA [Butyrivibrio sp.]
MAKKGGTPITVSQMRKIHVLAREYGLDDDLLHIHVRTVTGKDSLKKLSLREAVRVIDSLEKKSAEQMSWKQQYLMEKLLVELGWIDEKGKPDYKRLDGFCSKRYGVGSHKWLTRAAASKVIEGLKSMLQHGAPAESTGSGASDTIQP